MHFLNLRAVLHVFQCYLSFTLVQHLLEHKNCRTFNLFCGEKNLRTNFYSRSRRNNNRTMLVAEQPAATAAKAAQCTPPSTINMLSFNNIGLLVLLPSLNMMMMAAPYTFMPLHFLDQSWSLTTLGLCLMLGNGLRTITSTVVTRYGDWSVVLFLLLAVVSHIWLFCSPSSLVPTFVTMATMFSGNSMLSLQGLMHRRFGKEGEEIVKEALRTFAICETVSYATATLVGGLLYEFGGWHLCISVQFVIVVLQVVLFCVLPSVQEDMRENCLLCCGRSGGGGRDSVVADVLSGAIATSSNQKPEEETTVVDGTTFTASQIYESIKNYVWVVLAFHFMNLFTYATEWALFAVFFRQQYNWSSSWTGAGQMSGDLLAALVMFLSITVFKKTSSKKTNLTAGNELDVEQQVVALQGIDGAAASPSSLTIRAAVAVAVTPSAAPTIEPYLPPSRLHVTGGGRKNVHIVSSTTFYPRAIFRTCRGDCILSSGAVCVSSVRE